MQLLHIMKVWGWRDQGKPLQRGLNVESYWTHLDLQYLPRSLLYSVWIQQMCNPSRALRCWFPLALTLKRDAKMPRTTHRDYILHTGCSFHQVLWGHRKLGKYPGPALGVAKKIKLDRQIMGKKWRASRLQESQGMRAMEELEQFDWVKVAVGGITAQISTSQVPERVGGRATMSHGLEMVGKYATGSIYGLKIGLQSHYTRAVFLRATMHEGAVF